MSEIRFNNNNFLKLERIEWVASGIASAAGGKLSIEDQNGQASVASIRPPIRVPCGQKSARIDSSNCEHSDEEDELCERYHNASTAAGVANAREKRTISPRAQPASAHLFVLAAAEASSGKVLQCITQRSDA